MGVYRQMKSGSYQLNVGTNANHIQCTECEVSNKPSDAPECFHCGAELPEGAA